MVLNISGVVVPAFNFAILSQKGIASRGLYPAIAANINP